MSCRGVDELAAAYALGALDSDEERAISDHLAACRDPHDEVRAALAGAAVVAASFDAVEPSAALRDRLMASVAATPQEHRRIAPPPAPERAPLVPTPEPRRWWSLAPVPSAIAAVALAAAVGLGAWSISLNQQLAERDEALRLVAAADGAHRAQGSAGFGWVLESDGRAIFLADSLADLPADRIYELWLIGPDGTPVAVGTMTDTDGMALVELDRPLGTATTFAVTVEAARVEAPTSEPVLVASIEG